MSDQTTSAARFESWAKVELFGHNQIAGFCQEVTLAGVVMLRVDVPGPEQGTVKFTRFFHGNAIYAINPIDEELARELASQEDKAPVQPYDVSQLRDKIRESFVPRASAALPSHNHYYGDEPDDL